MGSDSTILKSLRDHPPTCSLVKLSHLNNKYESPLFVSGGYSWRLVIYPKGNEEDNGKGFVSMYVELDKSSPPTEVFAYLSFFVFNKKENKYFSIQDVEAKPFNSVKTVWGVSQVLSLETFNDLEKGYILEGEQCEFGADVMIASSKEKLAIPKFSWRVRDFSVLKQNDYVSKTFPMGEKHWTLKLYPKGDSKEDGKLFTTLHLADLQSLLPGELIFVRFQLLVLDPHGSTHSTGWRGNSWVMNSNKAWGVVKSVSLAQLREAYLDLEDALNVEIECEVVNSIKNHPFF